MQEKGFVVSALKYRPSIFSEVVAQKGITSTLMNAIDSEELAKAYLFCGPRGVGKTTCARIFAKAINAKYIPEGTDMSFNIFEMDAASNNSVDDIRNLIDQVRIQPQLGKYKVYVIDEVHMLSSQAFNAFLKTLEEPPAHAIFILATTEKHKVLPTILSRCQIYDFQRIQVKDIVEHLAHIAQDQNVTYQEEALHLIANKADGALRDALSLYDQMVSFTGKNLQYQTVADNLNVLDHDYFLKITDHIAAGEVGDTLLILDEIMQRGFDGLMFLLGLAEHLRNLLVSMDPATLRLLDTTDQVKESYLNQAAKFTAVDIVEMLDKIQKSELAYRVSKNKRLLTELTLMQLGSKYMEPGQPIEKKTPVSKPLSPKQPESQATTAPTMPVPDAPKVEVIIQKAEQPKAEAKPVPPAPLAAHKATEAPQELKAPVVEAKTEAQPEKPAEAKAPEPLTAAEPASPKTSSRKRRGSGFSLNELEEEQGEAEKSKEPEAIDHEQEIDRTELMVAWKKYADLMQEQGKFSFYSTLANNEPKILDNRRIQITLENEVQVSDLNSEKAELMAFIRAEIAHPGLLLESIIDIEDKGKMAYRTPKEQFQEMANKNPVLKKMSQQFDLDLDY